MKHALSYCADLQAGDLLRIRPSSPRANARNRDENYASNPFQRDKAARCPYYLIFEASGGFVESVKNPFKAVVGPVAPKAVKLLVEKKIKAVVAERFGKTMEKCLDDEGIGKIQMAGSVDKTLDRSLRRRPYYKL